MDYIKIIYNWLGNYRRNQEQLKSKKLRYKDIESNIPGEPISYDKERLSPTNVIHSAVENKAIALAELAEDIKRMENTQEFIHNAICNLKPIERQVIAYKYMVEEPMTWRDISDKVERSERQCINIRNKAVEKMEREFK